MEHAPEHTPEREPHPPRNLLTHPAETIKALATLEGPGWMHTEERNRKAAEVEGKEPETNVFGVLERLQRMTPEERAEETHIIGEFYGGGGVTRYKVWSDGMVRFTGFHARQRQDHGDYLRRAQTLGFEMYD